MLTEMRNLRAPTVARLPFRAVIAYLSAAGSSAHHPDNVVSAPAISLPSISLNRRVLTFSAANSIVSNPSNASTAELASARALLKDMGTPVTLSSQTGNIIQPPPSVVAFGIAPTSDPQIAFTSFTAAQKALIAGASLSKQFLPPHVVVPGIGKWTYIYTLESDFSRMLSILAHLRCILKDLYINSTPLLPIVQTLSDSAVAGVVKWLSNEKSKFVRSTTSTTVPLRTRQALASALSCHINRIYEIRSAIAPACSAMGFRGCTQETPNPQPQET